MSAERRIIMKTFPRIFVRLSVALAVAGLAGCAALQATQPTAVHQPMTVRPEPRSAQASQPGSIFQSSFSRPLFEDRRARFVGDPGGTPMLLVHEVGPGAGRAKALFPPTPQGVAAAGAWASLTSGGGSSWWDQWSPSTVTKPPERSPDKSGNY